MRKTGLDEDQITVKLLTVGILTIQRKYDVNPQAIFDVHEQIRATNKQLAIRLDDESGVNVLRLIPNAYDSMKEQIIRDEKLMMILEADIKNSSEGKSK